MTYATQADIVTLYSPDALHVADRDGDGVPDAGAVARALDLASAEIDSYIGARYRLPLEEPPAILMQYAVDIALYRLALSRDVASTEHRTRYDDARAALKDLSNGKSVLVFPGGADGDDTDAVAEPRPIVSGGPERQFTRDKMAGL